MSEYCLECGRGFYDECELEECPCLIHSPVADEEIDGSLGKVNSTDDEDSDEVLFDRSKKYKDALSSGRKQAAVLYPFICSECGHTKPRHDKSGACTRDSCVCDEFVWRPCGWQNLKSAGGGRNPIIGCLDGRGTNRHHGPIKDTLRNELGNVHLICTMCHNHWHAINDEYYNEDTYMKLPHTPESATADEVAKDMLDWKLGRMKDRYILKDTRGLKNYD